MHIGIALPHMGETTPTMIVRIAQEAEHLGYASLWAGERLLRPRAYRPFGFPPGPMPDYFKISYDPLETLSFIAGQTKRIKLGTSVMVAPFHPPVVLARRLATLDQLSRGRVIAGLGQGWLRDEFEATNASFQSRGDRLEDYIRAVRAVWGPNPVRYEGPFYRIGESDIGPKPLQAGGPPLLLGVGAPVALERAARLSDGLNPIALSWKQLIWTMREFPAMVRRAGRDPQRMLIVLRSNYPVSPNPLPEPRNPLHGCMEQIREDVQRLEELGIGHIFFDLVSFPLHQHLELLARLRSVAK